MRVFLVQNLWNSVCTLYSQHISIQTSYISSAPWPCMASCCLSYSIVPEFQGWVCRQALLTYTKYTDVSKHNFSAELLRPSVMCLTIPARLVVSLLCITPSSFLPPSLAFGVPLTNELLCFLFAFLMPSPATVPSPPGLQQFLMLILQSFLQQPLMGGP